MALAPLHPSPKADVEQLVNEEKKRQSEFVSCWHMNESESDAMWKLYGLRGQGIAIRSTVRRLREAIAGDPSEVYLGQVRYVDYSRDTIPLDRPMVRILSKRRSFAHEAELRVIVLKYPDPKLQRSNLFALLRTLPGVLVNIDLGKLIDSIWISPDSELWVADTLKSVAAKFGIDPDIVQHSPLNRRNPVSLPTWQVR